MQGIKRTGVVKDYEQNGDTPNAIQLRQTLHISRLNNYKYVRPVKKGGLV
jgi:hypothetical protein